MCLQCCTDALSYGEIVPGFYLMKAQKSYFEEWCEGEYALVECNNPTYYLKGISTPATDPTFGLSPHEEEAVYNNSELDTALDLFVEQLHQMFDNLQGSPKSGWLLYEASKKAGYNEDAHGNLESWLLHKIACTVRDVTPKHHSE